MSEQAEPAQCPFCESDVDEDLILYGGPCPSCFTDIPGEEAPTDPGEEVKAAAERKESTRAWLKAVLSLVLLGVPALGVLVLVAIYVIFLRATPEPMVMNFDGDGEAFEIELVGAAKEEKKAKTKKAKVKQQAKLASRVEEKAEVEPAAPAPASGGLGLDLGATSIKRAGPSLSESGDIKMMIFRVMKAEMPKLKSCYEMRLKSNENLQGRWQMKFTVMPSGKTRGVSVTGLNMSDPEMESCVSTKIGLWTFEKITREQPVQRSISFKPGL